ncbi:MAG TPA: ComEC/Rec2 family competence protein [Pyrinomonadaceae bacterium]|nr:ComEC/Rec2 family competence protein [Pyrinomonadaceae bacterium]
MAEFNKGCGCVLAALAVFLIIVALLGYFFVWPWWEKRRVPPPSGGELEVHVLDVGQGDSILIIAPEDKETKQRKVALIDSGDTGRGKVVLDAMKRYNVSQIDLFIASHAHADHIGGADEVIKATSVRMVLDSSVPPPARATDEAATANQTGGSRRGRGGNSNGGRSSRGSTAELPTTKSYRDLLESIDQAGAQYVKAEPGQKFELSGGAVITVLAPIQPFFTKDQLRSGGNEPNANSVVVRLDYGKFSMILTGDAEAQTEERMINKDANLGAKVLKVGHHGSKYATSENFVKAVKPEVAIISTGANNRYGHPSQDALNRLKAAGAKVYRTDLQGEITIITKGEGYEIKTGKEPKDADVWAGREAQKDDSARSGFISYGDFGPPPRERKEKTAKK